jgi:hypothetical protein
MSAPKKPAHHICSHPAQSNHSELHNFPIFQIDSTQTP